MIALLTSRLAGYLYIAVAAGLLAWWGYNHIYDNGYKAAEAHYTAIIAEEHEALLQADLNEQRRQMIANNAAKKREAEALAALEVEEAKNLELRKELRREAEQDPDRDRVVLGASSVQRINKIR